MKVMKVFAALGVAVSLFAAGLGIVNASDEEPASCKHSYIVETTSQIGDWCEACDKDKGCIIHKTEHIKVRVCGSCGKYLGSYRWTNGTHSKIH